MTPIRIGMAMWSHSNWRNSLFAGATHTSDRLRRYAEMFNTVEGNTTFYATPSEATVRDWYSAVPSDFRFTFKFPQEITHKHQLQHCDVQLHDFFQRMSPLMELTGLWKIQLPRFFTPDALPILNAFILSLPQEMPVGVEVRHDAFFAKGIEEQQLNRMLMDLGANRIIMDSRPVFAATPDSAAVIDAQLKKPRVPVHAIATGQYPMVRYIGHPHLSDNDMFFQKWREKLCQWMAEGREPLLFIHTPDNIEAPELAHRLYQQLSDTWHQKQGKKLPELKPLYCTKPSSQLGLEL